MNIKHIFFVFRKEIKDIFRDKRTWIASVLIPMLVFPLLFYFMGKGMSKMEKNLQNDIAVFIETDELNADIVNYLKNGKGLKIIDADNPYSALEKGDIKAVIKIEENFQDKIDKKIPAQVKIMFDEVSNESDMAASIVEGVINGYSEEVRLERLAHMGIEPSVLQPAIVKREAYIPEGQESKGDSAVLMAITFILPFFLMIYPLVGGMPAAIDLGAGEKERMSLEPLLATGADRLSILTGKYLTVFLASLLGTITSLVGVFAASRVSPKMMPLEIHISALSMLILVVTSLLIA
ncbi:MAG: ABC transporter permease, partial [Syntrophomonadaceae bacterium]|nr:ABC transporter permease [Syntrophomonadaceae bacterium]